MCGICGFINRDGTPASPDIVGQMSAMLVHRGPDDVGEYVGGAVALGHRRLSIVDVARGHQPMSLADRLHIVYNGEVKNHREIREQLPLSPQSFHTTCDTETVLAAFGQWGLDCVKRFCGMFAFAVYDSEEDVLFLARDRLGIKPLYVYESDRLFAFASEIKALLAHPAIRAEVNVAKLPVQLALKYTLDDETLFRGIKKVPPGHVLRVTTDRVERIQYWDLSFAPKHQFSSLDEAAAAFRERFYESVRRRLMADVPLGVFLSGGVDSSVIAAAMTKIAQRPIKTFSVAFEQHGYSELEYARAVASHIGAESREVVVSPEEWLHAWPLMVYHEDEPLAHPSSIPLHFVSKLASQEVKVVLTGEGADELLAGYSRYRQTLTNLRWGRFVPGSMRNAACTLIDLLPNRLSIKRKAVRTSLYLPHDIEALYLDNYSAFPRRDVARALQPPYREAALNGVYDDFSRLMETCDSDDLLDQLLYADMKTYLVELLMKQDQMSMSASIESRVPFLDHELVEFACRLPPEHKLSGAATKRILRHALGDTVPADIAHRRKMGFPTPTRQWFRGQFASHMETLLLSHDSLSREYVVPEYTRRLLERHRSGEWNLEEQIWTLGNLELWLRIFMDGQDPRAIFAPARREVVCASSG